MNTSFKTRHLVLAALVSAAFTLPVQAKYKGPATPPATPSVADILQNPVDDQDVRLQGQLLRKTGDETYVFSDGTGEILVDIDDDDFPSQAIDDKTRVELLGEVDTGRTRPPEIDVDHVKVL